MKWQPIKNPETSRTYKEEAIELAFSWCPEIYPCKKCGHPVVDGYCCGTCGDAIPDEETCNE